MPARASESAKLGLIKNYHVPGYVGQGGWGQALYLLKGGAHSCYNKELLRAPEAPKRTQNRSRVLPSPNSPERKS